VRLAVRTASSLAFLAAVAIHNDIRDLALDCFAEFTPAPEPGLAMTAIPSHGAML